MAELAASLHLVDLICARLCHDLSGLVGTVNQALELAADDGVPAGEAFDLGRTAAEELMQRLRLLRAAWGPAGEDLDLTALRALAAGLSNARHLTLDLSGLPDGVVFGPAMGRMVLNLLLLANDSLPAGGQIVLSGGAEDVFIGIAGPRAAWPVGLPSCLMDEAAAYEACSSARTIQMPLTALLARHTNLRLSLLMAGTELMASTQGGPPPLRVTVR